MLGLLSLVEIQNQMQRLYKDAQTPNRPPDLIPLNLVNHAGSTDLIIHFMPIKFLNPSFIDLFSSVPQTTT